MLKYEDRLPLRKISQSLNRQYEGLNLSAATCLEVTNRVSEALEPQYENIKKEIKKTSALNADETGAKLNGKKHWFWVFAGINLVLFLLRKKREHKVVKEALGENYEGIITSDGYQGYAKYAKKIQRCWAHLLREAKFLAQKYKGQARIMYNNLCELFEAIKKKKIEYETCIRQMKSIINIATKYQQLKKIAVTMKNGLEDWFTCVKHPEIEPTNNRAERELREFVVQRQIFGSLRSQKGLKITEKIMSVLATWRCQGLNTYKMLRTTLSS